MERRFFSVFGAAVVVGVVALVFAFGPPDTVETRVWMGSFAVAGLSFVLAGVRETLRLGPVTVGWYVPAGVGDLFVGVGMLASGLSMLDGGRDESAIGVAVVAVAVPILLFFAVEYLRGGHFLDIGAAD